MVGLTLSATVKVAVSVAVQPFWSVTVTVAVYDWPQSVAAVPIWLTTVLEVVISALVCALAFTASPLHTIVFPPWPPVTSMLTG